MADSENSRTLPSITQRNIPAAVDHMLMQVAAEQAGNSNRGNVLEKWQAWRRAHHECTRLCYEQQRLERELFHTIAGPLPEALGPLGSRPKDYETREGQAADLGGAFTAVRESAAAKSVVRRRGWKSADQLTGYRSAEAREDLASAKELQLSNELWGTSAGSIVSAMAKLHVTITQGEPEPDSNEFPWPQIRSVLRDLLMASTRDASMPLDPGESDRNFGRRLPLSSA